MREGLVRCPCELAAVDMWRVRADLNLDRVVADRERRTIRQVGTDATESDDDGAPVLVRTTIIELPADFVPSFFRRWVTHDQLTTRVTTRWHEDLHDEAHACVVDIAFPAFPDKVEMGYRQWLERSSAGENACTLCTRTRIAVRADDKIPQWVCSAIEGIAEASMHASLRAYPKIASGFVAPAMAPAVEGRARPRKTRVPTTDDGAAEPAAPPRGGRFFCHCELLGFVRIVCGSRRAILEDEE